MVEKTKIKNRRHFGRTADFSLKHNNMYYLTVSILLFLDELLKRVLFIKRTVNMSKKVKIVVPKGHRMIFRASKKDKNGNKIYARDYGLRGFPIFIPIA